MISTVVFTISFSSSRVACLISSDTTMLPAYPARASSIQLRTCSVSEVVIWPPLDLKVQIRALYKATSKCQEIWPSTSLTVISPDLKPVTCNRQIPSTASFIHNTLQLLTNTVSSQLSHTIFAAVQATQRLASRIPFAPPTPSFCRSGSRAVTRKTPLIDAKDYPRAVAQHLPLSFALTRAN